jgi:hypothetical protein
MSTAKDPYAASPPIPPGFLDEKQTKVARAFISEVATIDKSIAGDVLMRSKPEELLLAIIQSARQVAKMIGA